MKKACELGKCPGGCGDEVVVTCTGSLLGTFKGGVHCRFGSAHATACVYEEESGTLTCTPPKVCKAVFPQCSLDRRLPCTPPPPGPQFALKMLLDTINM